MIASIAGTHCHATNGTASSNTTIRRRPLSAQASNGPAKNWPILLMLPPSGFATRNTAAAAAEYVAAAHASVRADGPIVSTITRAIARSHPKAHGSYGNQPVVGKSREIAARGRPAHSPTATPARRFSRRDSAHAHTASSAPTPATGLVNDVAAANTAPSGTARCASATTAASANASPHANVMRPTIRLHTVPAANQIDP